jgi:hypothetical protein
VNASAQKKICNVSGDKTSRGAQNKIGTMPTIFALLIACSKFRKLSDCEGWSQPSLPAYIIEEVRHLRLKRGHYLESGGALEESKGDQNKIKHESVDIW